MRGERSVSSHPRMRAFSMVRGKKRLDSPMVLWSKKFRTRGAESVGIERPSAEGNGHAELMFFVTLAEERDEFATICRAQLRQRTGSGEQRRGLIIVSVESTEGPAQSRS